MSLPVMEPIVRELYPVLDKYRLDRAWTYVIAHHTSNLGYHNLDHITVAMAAAAWLARRERADEKLAIIAAMVHDLCHTGHGPDTNNIEIAINEFQRMCNTKVQHRQILDLTVSEQERVMQAVFCTQCVNGTEFPIKPVSVLDTVMRDADLWNPHLAPRNARYLIAGLGREIGTWDEKTLDKGIDSTIKFFEKVTWHTDTARGLSTVIPDRLHRLYLPQPIGVRNGPNT